MTEENNYTVITENVNLYNEHSSCGLFCGFLIVPVKTINLNDDKYLYKQAKKNISMEF